VEPWLRATRHGQRSICPDEGRWGRRISSGWQGGPVSVRGVLQVHSAPPALCPHIEWAVAGIVGAPVRLSWVDQPASPGTLRAELDWRARPGTSATITSALAAWHRLRFEVTEEASPGCDAVRYSCTPTLGTFSAVTSACGDILVPEGRLRAAGPRATPPRPARTWTPYAMRTARGTRRSAARWRPSSSCCWASPGTMSSSRSGTPPTVLRCAGCTPPADIPGLDRRQVPGARRGGSEDHHRLRSRHR